MTFRGAFTALVTPLRDGEFDEESYRDLIEWQIEQGIHGLVPCGTTGEAATMGHAEQGRVIRVCVDQAKGRVPIIAGAGSNNTKEAIELTVLAKEAGADGALQITPYYNKPTPDGLVAHFKAIAAQASMPFIVYNVPGRTGLNCLPPTLARIAREVPEVVGVKEATANLRQLSDVLEECGRDFTMLSGDDFTVLPCLAVGGDGVISVSSNIAPKLMADMCEAFFDNEMDKAQDLHYQLQPICRAMFLETNPIPVKTSLSLMGRVNKEFRLPLVPMTPANETALRDVLSQAGLI
jgi:4-hydroxy-tetrahydrodipicolinate synthase